jgi:hypothetical protein
MKNFKFLFSVAVASALIGCSSMSIDEEDALAGNFPEDFSDVTYMNLHPELVRVQVKDFVAKYNAKLEEDAKAAETTAAFDSIKAADTAAYFGDTALLHKIMVDPMFAGFTEAAWTTAWTSTTRDTTYDVPKDTVQVEIYDSTSATKIQMRLFDADSAKKGSIVVTDGKITAVTGYRYDYKKDTTELVVKATDASYKFILVDADSAMKGSVVVTDGKITKVTGYKYESADGKTWTTADSTLLVEFEVADGMTIESKGIKTKDSWSTADATLLVDLAIDEKMSIDSAKGIQVTLETVTEQLPVEGGLSKQQLTVLKSLNLYGVADDYAKLKEFQVDMFAVAYQYVVFGREHGWAYRLCTEAEKANAPYDPEVYPATKLYCADDNGITHEIN